MYAYAFFYTPSVPLKLPNGIAGSVEMMGNAHLSVLVEPGLSWEALQENDEQLIQAVLSYDRVICELFAQTTVLPLRFGTRFVSRESLLNHLDSQGYEYLKKLSRLQGKGEYTLKCMPLEMPVEISGTPGQASREVAVPGREYFLAKKRLYQLQLEHQRQQATEWQNLQVAIAHSYPGNTVLGEAEGSVERIYLLAPLQEESLLRDHVQNWQSECTYWAMTLSSALPPYHFA
ncbi:MAG: GvpL/GvpF family gas vesicle protein [Actinomycetota bacterium]